MFSSSTNPFCKYKNALGVPGKGAHFHPRYFDFAVWDITFTVLGAYIIYWILSFFTPRVSFWIVLLSLFLLGIFLHRLFCVQTTIDKILFP
jgi:hypothetical protein